MKKMMLLGALLLSAAAGFAQESRQDVSVSGIGIFTPQVHGNAITQDTSKTFGFLASYRYMLTPRSALEVNYSFLQNQQYYTTSFLSGNIHQRQQEISGAFVYGLNFRRYNPFIEAGPGALVFTPIRDFASTSFDTKQVFGLGGIFGGGVAYELSPSFDVRVEYRGFLTKAPAYGLTNFDTKRWEVISLPAVGLAYHF
ncbi:MAG: outer membrane beta-barrel protein [Acidobacteriota bacterium]|nr:outer membrane beta-barrel protein [Acidobacteriota bacterium]